MIYTTAIHFLVLPQPSEQILTSVNKMKDSEEKPQCFQDPPFTGFGLCFDSAVIHVIRAVVTRIRWHSQFTIGTLLIM